MNFKSYFIINNVCVCFCEYAHHVCVGVDGDQKEMLDLLALELQVVVRAPMWELGFELGSSRRTTHSLDS